MTTDGTWIDPGLVAASATLVVAGAAAVLAIPAIIELARVERRRR